MLRILFVLMLAAAGPVLGCPGVIDTRTDDGNWVTHVFEKDVAARNRIVVTVTVADVEPGVIVQRHLDGRWSAVAASATFPADGVRFTSGGVLTLSYEFDQCIDVVEPELD